MGQAVDDWYLRLPSQGLGRGVGVHIDALEGAASRGEHEQAQDQPLSEAVFVGRAERLPFILVAHAEREPLHLINLATSLADSMTSGMPPPGWTLPPTK